MRILFLLILSTSSLQAQLPGFESNVDEKFINSQITLKKYGNTYNQVISFTTHSHWAGQKIYFVLYQENHCWQLHKLIVKKRPNGKQKFKKKERLDLDQQAANNFISLLIDINFWDINQVSLNKSEKDNGNGTKLVQEILDGITYQFLVKSNQSYRLISAHSPESRQKFLVTDDRRKFIAAKDSFYQLIPKSER